MLRAAGTAAVGPPRQGLTLAARPLDRGPPRPTCPAPPPMHSSSGSSGRPPPGAAWGAAMAAHAPAAAWALAPLPHPSGPGRRRKRRQPIHWSSGLLKHAWAAGGAQLTRPLAERQCSQVRSSSGSARHAGVPRHVSAPPGQPAGTRGTAAPATPPLPPGPALAATAAGTRGGGSSCRSRLRGGRGARRFMMQAA